MVRLICILMLVELSFSYNVDEVHDFVESSITISNATKLGFDSYDEATSWTLGTEFKVYHIITDSIKQYPLSQLISDNYTKYVPILVNDNIICLATLSEEGHPTSLGYGQLAKEMQYIITSQGVAIDSITLYSSVQIKSYLFSIPPRSRNDKKNLTILRPNWNRNRSVLSLEEDVVAELKKVLVK